MHTINVQPHEIFQALADPTRIRIVRLLAETGEEACLCELVDSLLEPQYKLSRHVKILRQAGLLSAEKDGRWVYHRLVRGVPYLELAYDMLRALPDVGGLFAQDLHRFRERMCLRCRWPCKNDPPWPSKLTHLRYPASDDVHQEASCVDEGGRNGDHDSPQTRT